MLPICSMLMMMPTHGCDKGRGNSPRNKEEQSLNLLRRRRLHLRRRRLRRRRLLLLHRSILLLRRRIHLRRHCRHCAVRRKAAAY